MFAIHVTPQYINAHQFLLFLPPPSCSRVATPPTGAAKRRESRGLIILRFVLFCFARIVKINELIRYNSLLHTKLFLLLLTSLLPVVFFPVFTTMSSTSGKLPADCNVVGSSVDGVATEVRHICFANGFIFFLLITFLLISSPLLVFHSRQHIERLVPATKPSRTAVQVQMTGLMRPKGRDTFKTL